jgi:SAM-dependent methyltransferase
MGKSFEDYVSDALAHVHEGWNFAYIASRRHSENPPWVYGDRVLAEASGVESMLDMGTGGGEFLLSLHQWASYWPPKVCATEGYAPNVAVATRNLAPIGVEVLAYESDDQLPFDDESFDLVINRHESFSPQELMRILKPGCKFITQQVGGEMTVGLNEALQAPDPLYRYWTLDYVTQRLEAAEFEILAQQENYGKEIFDDIGAIVWYLNVVSWQIPDFTLDRYGDRLRALHARIQAQGPLEVQNHHLYIEARKPSQGS